MYKIPSAVRGESSAWATKAFVLGMICIIVSFGIAMLLTAPLTSGIPLLFVPWL